MDKDFKREVILDNYQHPTHKGLVDDNSFITKNTNNDSCIDNIDMQMKVENGVVVDAYFDGEACAISTASTSIMIKKIIGMTLEEARTFTENFENMVNEKEYDEEELGEALAFDEIYKQESRKTCATLPYKGLIKIINED